MEFDEDIENKLNVADVFLMHMGGGNVVATGSYSRTAKRRQLTMWHKFMCILGPVRRDVVFFCYFPWRWFGVALARWSRATKLSYVGLG